jgi:hypothetical protein
MVTQFSLLTVTGHFHTGLYTFLHSSALTTFNQQLHFPELSVLHLNNVSLNPLTQTKSNYYITFSITGSHYSPLHYNTQNLISARYTKQTHVTSEISVFMLDIQSTLFMLDSYCQRKGGEAVYITGTQRSGDLPRYIWFVFPGSIYHYLPTDKLIRPFRFCVKIFSRSVHARDQKRFFTGARTRCWQPW